MVRRFADRAPCPTPFNPAPLEPAMPLRDLVAPNAVFPSLRVNSKKQALQELAERAARLAADGVHFVGPATGDLACGYEGIGRLAPVDEILAEIGRILAQK